MSDEPAESDDKRTAARVQPFVVQCGVREGDTQHSAYLTELSIAGARVVTFREAPASGAQLMLEVRFSGQLESVNLPARVVWTRPASPPEDASFGVSFDGISIDDRRVLDTVLGEFRRMAAQIEEPQRRQEWVAGPEKETPRGDWLGLSDDELLLRISGLGEGHDADAALIRVVDSERHFFIRQEAAKRIRDPELLKKHAGDRHIGQILARVMTREEDVSYLEKLAQETRYLEVRKAAVAQLRKVIAVKRQKGG